MPASLGKAFLAKDDTEREEEKCFLMDYVHNRFSYPKLRLVNKF